MTLTRGVMVCHLERRAIEQAGKREEGIIRLSRYLPILVLWATNFGSFKCTLLMVRSKFMERGV